MNRQEKLEKIRDLICITFTKDMGNPICPDCGMDAGCGNIIRILAQQIDALYSQSYQPSPELLLTKREIKDILMGRSVWYELENSQMIATAQLAKAEPLIRADQAAKVRREIGEWLFGLCKHTTNPLQQMKLCKKCACDLAESLFEGQSPEQEGK